ncbi:universal stress protein [Streptomyces sp. PTM05]|uniref:Universal stress protein n=1 Tax=Streptantibioticus parmotrematis TaxID=2873249 RepID=A0ABS7R0T1_9ACTN|nr:universal stress protein [Streptantibioticus parmotrematis]MBY8889076.1 universal stress protein [Streptantibioticus parmotrematis]
MSERTAGGRIVVGADGSAASRAALAWAVGQARLTGASVEAVIAWEYPAGVYAGWSAPLPDVDFGELAAKTLSELVATVAAGEPSVEVRQTVVADNASRALLDTARGADLLVVGNRGHGGFTEALLGSVSQHCVQHADCPVVVVRGEKE